MLQSLEVVVWNKNSAKQSRGHTRFLIAQDCGPHILAGNADVGEIGFLTLRIAGSAVNPRLPDYAATMTGNRTLNAVPLPTVLSTRTRA